MPLENVNLAYWFLIVGAPMIVAALLVARTLGLARYDLGLTVRAVPVQLAIGALGVGIAEYFILGHLVQVHLANPASACSMGGAEGV
jgi:hypothetical protein